MINSENCCFLIHYTPPAVFGEAPALFLSAPDGSFRRVSIGEVSAETRPIVTHSFSFLVEWLRRDNLPLPSRVIDLESAAKLVEGKPKSQFTGELPWELPAILQSASTVGVDERSKWVVMARHLVKPEFCGTGASDGMSTVALHLAAAWRRYIERMTRTHELSRFFDIEVPTYNAMLLSQYRGIAINRPLAERYVAELDNVFLSAHFNVSIRLCIDVDRALVDMDYLQMHLSEPLSANERYATTEELIRARAGRDATCTSLKALLQAKRNRSILLRTVDLESGVCFPMFDVMGTVTGRVLAIDPLLQQLAKKYRSVVTARNGYRLLYLDYSQFEPNIIASLSEDERLRALCSGGDLYESISTMVCGDVKRRDAMKMMFLAYSYGQQLDMMSCMLSPVLGSIEEAQQAIVSKVCPLFENVEKWKKQIQARLCEEGRISTIFGNHRERVSSGALTMKEQRWAVSQVVQGTGSLVLKKVIIELFSQCSNVHILLPMHDALLMEIPESSATDVAADIASRFERVFLETCPGVIPRVKEKEFAAATPIDG